MSNKILGPIFDLVIIGIALLLLVASIFMSLDKQHRPSIMQVKLSSAHIDMVEKSHSPYKDLNEKIQAEIDAFEKELNKKK